MAAMTIAVAFEGRCNKFLINDINAPVVSLLKDSIESPDLLFKNYSELWNAQFNYKDGSEKHFYEVRDRFNSGEEYSHIMLYLIARCVKGSIRYGSNGKFNQSPDKRRNGTKPETLLKNIRMISILLKGKCDFFSRDYRDILAETGPGI